MNEYSKLIDEWMEEHSGFEHPQDCTVEERIACSSMRHALGELVTAITTPLHERIRELEKAAIVNHHGLGLAIDERDSLRSKVSELEKDKERLDWIQTGHCVLALSQKHIGKTIPKFEIDGHQNCAVDEDVRKAIDSAITQSQSAKEK